MATLNDVTAAVLARLRTVATLNVYEPDPPATPPKDKPWVIVNPETGYTYPNRLAGGSTGWQWPVMVVCAGRSRTQALAAAQQVRDMLDNWRLNPDPSTSPFREQTSGPLISDDTVPSDIRYSLTLRYTAHLERTPA